MDTEIESETRRFKQMERLSRLGVFFLIVTASNVVISVLLSLQTQRMQENIARNLERLTQLEGHLDRLEDKIVELLDCTRKI
ncbi:hypothetical protein [Helicobacter salomonis]|uniref:hypothetical protein n=1 Tax=Helicobacter salomonis TaxID=56878 RepID=UPI000CF0BC9A|nr:hypothetical protein [Helicobacter salomonis]